MLEIFVMALLLFGVPILVVMILAGAAAYVREGAERELEAMAEREGIDLDDPDSFVESGGTPPDERSGIDAVERSVHEEDSSAESNPAGSNDDH